MVKMNTHSVCRSGIREAPIIVKKKFARTKNKRRRTAIILALGAFLYWTVGRKKQEGRAKYSDASGRTSSAYCLSPPFSLAESDSTFTVVHYTKRILSLFVKQQAGQLLELDPKSKSIF